MTGGKVKWDNVTCAADPAPTLSLKEMRDAVRAMPKVATYVRMTKTQFDRIVTQGVMQRGKGHNPESNQAFYSLPIEIAGSPQDLFRIANGEKSIDITRPHGIDPDEVRK